MVTKPPQSKLHRPKAVLPTSQLQSSRKANNKCPKAQVAYLMGAKATIINPLPKNLCDRADETIIHRSATPLQSIVCAQTSCISVRPESFRNCCE
jgi:hypothetical protein